MFVNSQNYQIASTVKFTLKNKFWPYIIHPCSAIAIEKYLKQYECVISAIKGNRGEIIAVHVCKQM
jgi:hypothetical protein